MNKAILLGSLLSLLTILLVNAQITNPKTKAKQQGNNKLNSKIKQGVDAGFDKLEKGMGRLFSKMKEKADNAGENKPEEQTESKTTSSGNSVSGQDTEALFAEHGMYPPDGASNVPVSVTLKWSPRDGARYYELYLNKINPDGTHEKSAPFGLSSKNEFTCSNLEINTTCNWKQVAIDTNEKYIPPGFGVSCTTVDGSVSASTAKITM